MSNGKVSHIQPNLTLQRTIDCGHLCDSLPCHPWNLPFWLTHHIAEALWVAKKEKKKSQENKGRNRFRKDMLDVLGTHITCFTNILYQSVILATQKKTSHECLQWSEKKINNELVCGWTISLCWCQHSSTQSKGVDAVIHAGITWLTHFVQSR